MALLASRLPDQALPLPRAGPAHPRPRPRRPAACSRTLRVAGIELEPLRRTVIRDGRQLDLSVKEFALLEALLRASPAFLSTEDLLEQAWDEFADPLTNTVTVIIGRLRRNLSPGRHHHHSRGRVPHRLNWALHSAGNGL
jgi:DNA-binding response OmpR family regulator